ncbi:MAG: hypothetical protein ABIA12_02640 [Candidatus Aenigmatarchaeota archaeon]
MEKNENGIECKENGSESIRTLNFGVKGLQRKRELIEERYARAKAKKSGLKVVRTKTKVKSALRRQLLKNYGFAVQGN